MITSHMLQNSRLALPATPSRIATLLQTSTKSLGFQIRFPNCNNRVYETRVPSSRGFLTVAAAAMESAGTESEVVPKPDPIVQYIVIRKDLVEALKWPLGSVISQGCHAAVAAIILHKDHPSTAEYTGMENLDNMHTVTLEVKGETQLRNLAQKLEAGGVAHKLWIEQPENFPTCLATRPYRKSEGQARLRRLYPELASSKVHDNQAPADYSDKLWGWGTGAYVPFPADDDLLAAGELELGPAEGLLGVHIVTILAAHGQEHLADADAGAHAQGLAEGPPHARLQAVGPGARQHLVDAQDVVGVAAHAQVERVLARELGHVLVARDPCRLQRLTAHVLLLPAHQVHAERELVHPLLLHPHVVDPELRIGNSSAEARLRVGLVLYLPVASRWPCACPSIHTTSHAALLLHMQCSV